MTQKLNKILVFLTVTAVVLTSAITAKPVYADDGTNGGTPEPVVEETPPVETVAEIIEQLPEGTEIVVVSEDGVESLASEEAAQVILESDPIWCPTGQTPGNDMNDTIQDCTDSYATVTNLINNLGTKSGSGTIFFTSTYTVNDATLDHTDLNLSNLTDLTIQGGWNGNSGPTFGLSGNTTFIGVPLAITNWAGNVTLNNIFVDSVASNTGIYVGTTGNITLTDTSSTNNGFDGADLVNYSGSGNVTVTNGDFSDNNSTGLYIISSGDVAINNMTVNNNLYGAVVDNADGTQDVNITGSDFNNNSSTGLQVKSAGNITLNDVNADGNFVGAYLNALSGTGSVFIINNSTFDLNTEWGLKVFAGDGDISLTDVSANGNEDGSWLKSFNGDVSITNGVFSNNTDIGLLAIAGGQVDLTNVTLSNNGANGGEVYSIYNFACFGTKDIPVNITGGTYTGNGGYDLYVQPGAGAVTLDTTFVPIFGSGGLFVDTGVNPCLPSRDDDSTDEKPSKIIDVPETGQIDPELQDCENFSGTTLKLHTGAFAEVKCPFTGSSHITELTKDTLPGPLPNGLFFGSAINIDLENEGNPVPVMDEGGLITISFTIPEELVGKHLSIVYWDPTANDGQGGWVELPLEQFGGQYFPLYPDKPDDGRSICSGLEQSGNTVSVTVNFPGIFALVAR